MELLVAVASCELRVASCELRVASCELQVASCELRVASCELRVASCELRVASCELRVASCELRVNVFLRWANTLLIIFPVNTVTTQVSPITNFISSRKKLIKSAYMFVVFKTEKKTAFLSKDYISLFYTLLMA